MSNGLFGEFLKDLAEVSKKIITELEENKNDEKKPELLTAGKLSELRWMNPRQLATIYQYGKKKTTIDDTPEAYAELRWMTQAQLEAIFGKDGMAHG